MVDIEKREPKALLLAFGMPHRAVQCQVEIAAIGDSGQTIFQEKQFKLSALPCKLEMDIYPRLQDPGRMSMWT